MGTIEDDHRVNILKPLAKIRQRQVPWARRVLGMFVVVWLNMALQPCAMAFGNVDAKANGHDCPHCPPAHAAKDSSHAAHDMDHADTSTSPCEINASSCAFPDDFNFDVRSVKIKVENAPGDVPVGIVSSIAGNPSNGNSLQLSGIGDKSYVPPYRSALNVLYCVYLI